MNVACNFFEEHVHFRHMSSYVCVMHSAFPKFSEPATIPKSVYLTLCFIYRNPRALTLRLAGKILMCTIEKLLY